MLNHQIIQFVLIILTSYFNLYCNLFQKVIIIHVNIAQYQLKMYLTFSYEFIFLFFEFYFDFNWSM